MTCKLLAEQVSIECANGYHETCTGCSDHLTPERRRKACRCEHPDCHAAVPF